MERKIVKLRVDMYNDTKFKIIDTMEDRDLIHYIWTRLLTLAGKVNLEGKLYLSRSIPYTIETLALEFNRSVKKVELALKVFMDLEMIELGENNVYKVRNFAKHQNIKPKKKEDSNDKKEECNDKSKNVHNNVDNIESDVNKFDESDCIVENQLIGNEGDNYILESLYNLGGSTYENTKNSISNLNIEKHDEDKTTLHKSKDINITGVFERKVPTVNKENIQNSNKDCIKENKSNSKEFVVNHDKENEISNLYNNVKVVDFNSDKKDSDVNIESINVRDNINKKDNIEIQNKDILDKINLNKASATENFINNKSDVKNKIELKDKIDLDAEFVFSKANDNKKRSKPKMKNKKVSKKNDDEIISSWDDEADDIEICEFIDEPPKGKLIANFEF
ncbi:phage replisome organizer N-terminal domain-containing protein [Clostridium botulinum]|uniref:Phage replisome organiser N-terminal domain-containing protein n=1 Tax=Clostridium botulinum TaxID=1491 RepID=A0A6B4JGZ7_CLOBO|nr:phage replisome organizer N-terminal domain-containing protein [Clostridium botulinum]EES49771.1 phage replisome organizer family protein [Clostridium botulinum E1 str. 'BoNT E Beluga']MBY6759493.1 phage replisome organizer N-terminal domain-containing protein [Clostridium botulinum]MBY6914998.1 phage replisome organizer N-terminal domain-containing protein [Clostridium botulinum]MBY6918401.1 phage replisome organizer N-terminal domain-containing protein [Clostridium botulinum]MCR1129484.1 